ncbi:MAG: nicotinate phosphoribosyltransferase [bacterium]
MGKQIITSLLDQDLYKFSMAQAIYHNYTDVNARYSFTCRSPNVNLTSFIGDIREQVNSFCNLQFTDRDINKIKSKESLDFLKDDFLQHLRNTRLNSNYVTIRRTDEQGYISIVIEGPWINTIWFEVPILAIISELYMQQMIKAKEFNQHILIDSHIRRIMEQINNAREKYNLEEFPKFADFGTRRRASKTFQTSILDFLNKYKNYGCIGTSNVKMGLEKDMKIIGTMAHEWIMAHSAFTRFDLSQKMALDMWQKEYREKLGIALSDTYTTDFFLKDFDGLFSKSFSGIRQDSGDPIEIGYKMIRHYDKLGINPTTKQIIFSDGLNFDKIAQLSKEFKGKIQTGFGIGTNLTNNIGIDPLSMVIKLSHIQYGNSTWYPTIKISDSPGKIMCKDKEYEKFVQKIIKDRTFI